LSEVKKAQQNKLSIFNSSIYNSLFLQSNAWPLNRLLRIISVQAVVLFCSGHWFQLRLNVMYGRLLKTSSPIAAY